VKVRNEMDDPAPRVLADASRLTEIFVNLLRNARNAIAKRFETADETSPGTVRRIVAVESFVKGPYVCITLTNNGVPIPPAEQERIFLPIVSGRGGRGGVGLPETAAMMKEMGGAIQCQSMEEQGTRFLLTFRKAD
jgi:two-component system nitrogen regulation sensor histidine kinase GlnL